MAIPVTNIPVLTGEVAERFIEQCEYNAVTTQHPIVHE